MKFLIAQECRIGARYNNEDRIGQWASSDALLMAVADGLGGHAHGEIAAELAIGLLGAAFRREARPRIADPDAFLSRAIAAAHAAILREGRKLELEETPRTVLVACLVQDGYACWTHIGDCRLYLIRQGRILMRTRDHTVVQQLVDEGRIREEAIASHPQRNRLLQCLGGALTPQAEPPSRMRLAKDDLLLLCSDGLWGPLTQRQIVHALLAHGLEAGIRGLADLAERRGGAECDNVSVLAMAWGEEEVPDAAGTRAVTPEHLPTDVQDFTATDPDFMRMSDEDIDKAIAEIRVALRKQFPPQ